MNRSRLVTFVLVVPCLLFLRFLTPQDMACHDTKNPALLEAQSLLRGEIALPQRVHDSALWDGQVYNVFQPGQTLVFWGHLLLPGEPRFGNPLESGYALIYAGRDDELAERARAYGLFSIRFFPENLCRTFLAFPSLRFDNQWKPSVNGDPRGNSLLFSQPVSYLRLSPVESNGLRSLPGLTGLVEIFTDQRDSMPTVDATSRWCWIAGALGMLSHTVYTRW
ncbi:MAG: hypothetical protein N2508_13860 [Anaerolineae bacterium]|nr:hypothetical protein [Anaerolineae bacterium]